MAAEATESLVRPTSAVAATAPGDVRLDGFVAFDDVEKSYDGRTLVVKRLNLSIARGEFLTLLGPSGSGKTTILNMLAGFERPTRGTISLDGRPVDRLPPYERNIGMVFQNYALFPHMTAAENVAFPLSVRKIGKAEIAARVSSALDMVRLAPFAERKPAQIGCRQPSPGVDVRHLAHELPRSLTWKRGGQEGRCGGNDFFLLWRREEIHDRSSATAGGRAPSRR